MSSLVTQSEAAQDVRTRCETSVRGSTFSSLNKLNVTVLSSPAVFSLRVVKNDADCMTMSGAQTADAMPHVDTVVTALPLRRAMMHCKSHSVALAKR